MFAHARRRAGYFTEYALATLSEEDLEIAADTCLLVWLPSPTSLRRRNRDCVWRPEQERFLFGNAYEIVNEFYESTVPKVSVQLRCGRCEVPLA
jgi:hypothetical protein